MDLGAGFAERVFIVAGPNASTNQSSHLDRVVRYPRLGQTHAVAVLAMFSCLATLVSGAVRQLLDRGTNPPCDVVPIHDACVPMTVRLVFGLAL
jgi:hypothetical protein